MDVRMFFISLKKAIGYNFFSLTRKYFPGRLYKVTNWLFKIFKKQIKTHVEINNIYYQVDTNLYHERGLLLYGEPELGTMRYIKNQLAHIRDGILIDVGANIGIHTLNMAYHAANKPIKILAFEPNLEVFSRLKNNIILNNFSSIDAFQIGLHHESGFYDFYAPYADLQEGYVNPGLVSMSPIPNYKKKMPFKCDSLDKVFETNDYAFDQVRLIKIDVEGNELNVLRGATKILHESNPSIILEYNEKIYDDIVTYLDQLGYFPVGALLRYGIDENFKGENILFVPRN